MSPASRCRTTAAVIALLSAGTGATLPWALAVATPLPTAATEPFPVLSRERLGPLRIGSTAAEVRRAVACPIQRGPATLWAADGALHQRWRAPACGLELDLVSERPGPPPVVGSIRLGAPSPWRSAGGIGIGSPEAQVRRVYGADLNAQESQAGSLVVGSIYGGLIVTVRAGRVSGLFLGAAAE
ncbi:hypothetical protein [Cyanobium sp. Morenito 9A2]|uniref:hypothetical protein n=1 Tax=Cyanobium sp. Morenito 9A2 TaxID=2823718 RepID=UPI0020CBA5EB|nr:hypothetical protein [Cyanobium sp. Morenito 9A2]MCP9849032.1 hypothetical protein [Cyanobium sp. Morenito 9A2]